MSRRGSDGEPTLRERLRYRFDNILARGTWAVLAWLGVVTLIVVALASLSLRRVGVSFAGSTNGGLFEDFWQSLLRTLDTGTMAGDTGFRPRLVGLIVTLFGLLVAGTVIGVIASGVEAQIDRMKRGRSMVIESGHVVVLGASSMLPESVAQLVLANAGRRRAIVVLTERDSTEVSEEVRRVVRDTRGCRLVFRTGDPTRLDDLDLVRLREAREVIVLNGDGEHVGDARAVHTVLAARDLLGPDSSTPLVVVLDDARVAATVQGGSPNIHSLVASQAIGRTAAFALRQDGLGEVMADVLDFDGATLHVIDVPEAVGLEFGEVARRVVDVRPIGWFRGDGNVELNPSARGVIEPGDRLIVIADEGSVPMLSEATGSGAHQDEAGVEFDRGSTVDRLLVVGWNAMGPELLLGWAMTADPASTVEIVFDVGLVAESDVVVAELGVSSVVRTPMDGGVLAIDPATIGTATKIVLLSYSDRVAQGGTDSRTLLSLIALRRFLDASTEVAPRLMIELRDGANVPLAQSHGVDDVIVSPEMASRVLAQLTDQPDRRAVYLALYMPGGPSIRLVPVDRFGLVGEHGAREVFDTVLAHGVVAIGWRCAGETRLNPHDEERIEFRDGDEIVVIG